MAAPEERVVVTRPAQIVLGEKIVTTAQRSKKILEIVDVETETIVGYACGDCDRVGPTYGTILGHRRSHTVQETRKKDRSSAVDHLSKVIKDLDRLERENNRLQSRLKEERSARRNAERRIEQIERLFTPR